MFNFESCNYEGHVLHNVNYYESHLLMHANNTLLINDYNHITCCSTLYHNLDYMCDIDNLEANLIVISKSNY